MFFRSERRKTKEAAVKILKKIKERVRKIILSGRERLSLLLSKNTSISFLFSIRDYFIS